MIYIIYAVFIIFAFILALVAIYFMISLRLIKRNTKIINKRKLEILRIFDNLMQETSDSVDKDLNFLRKQFKTTNGFKAFHRAYQTYSEDNELSSNFRELLNSVVDYQAIFSNRNIKIFCKLWPIMYFFIIYTFTFYITFKTFWRCKNFVSIFIYINF